MFYSVTMNLLFFHYNYYNYYNYYFKLVGKVHFDLFWKLVTGGYHELRYFRN